MLQVRKGGHSDLNRFYSVMEVDFDSEELIGKIALHKGISDGSLELLIFSDEESKMDMGYALAAVKSVYGYVLIKYMGVLPWMRGHGVGIEIMRMLSKRYADKQGILAEITEFEDEDKDRVKKLFKFFARFGYVQTKLDYTIAGTKANLMVKPLKGGWDIDKVAHRMLKDIYSRFLLPFQVNTMLNFNN